MTSLYQQRTQFLNRGPLITPACEGSGVPGLVSILIPTFNRAYIVHKAIESVLNQTYRNIEVIVVDDGSTDDTARVIAQFGSRVQYIYQKNAGLAAARNTGLMAAQGEFIAFQDSDDLWAPWKLEAQVNLMCSAPEIGLTWTDMSAVDSAGTLLNYRHLRTMYDGFAKIDLDACLPVTGKLAKLLADCPQELCEQDFRVGDIADAMFIGNLVHPPTAVLRRTSIAQVGGLDLSFAWTCEDYEFFSRIALVSKCALIEAPGMLYRIDAVDQLTNPALMLYIARGNLEFIQRRLNSSAHALRLPSRRVRRHLADAHAWVGAEELESADGARQRALKHFARSLSINPLQRRILTLTVATLMLPGPLFNVARTTNSWVRARSRSILKLFG